jgi:hypothetical protein
MSASNCWPTLSRLRPIISQITYENGGTGREVQVPPNFLMEWFLKSLVPQLSKDVATSGVFSEEEAIMRAQQLELIYSQSSLLYKIFPDVPRSILDKSR